MNLSKFSPLLALVVLALAGCEADDNGLFRSGSVGGPPVLTGNNGGFGANDGTVTSAVYNDADGDGVISDSERLPGTFVCDYTVPAGTISEETPAEGVVGGPGDGLGTATVTGGVSEPERAVDTRLETFSSFLVTASGLDTVATINKVAEDFFMGAETPVNDYAAFAIRFPKNTVEATFNTVEITTYRGTDASGQPVQQEQKTVDITTIDLVQDLQTGEASLFIGLKVTKPYDYAKLAQGSTVSAGVGETMYVHEMCTRGHFTP